MSCGTGSDRILVFDPKADEARRLVPRILPGALCCSPVAMGSRLLAPIDAGQAVLLDPLSRGNVIATFQPRVLLSAIPQWREPVTSGDGEDAKEIVLSDGRTKLYRITMVDKPIAHLQAVAEVQTADPLVSPLARIGKMVCGVDAAGKANFYQLPDLSRTAQHSTGGCAWGPRGVGRCVMLVTGDEQLVCFDESGHPAWQVPLPYGPLAGAPLAEDERHVLLASAAGMVWRADATNGKELAKVDLGQPLSTGPVAIGKRLLVGSHDGCVLEVTGIKD